MNGRRMKTVFVLPVIINCIFVACATEFNIREIDFSAGNMPNKMLALKYFDRSNISIEQAKNILGNIFENDNSIYGYYYIYYDISKNEENIFNTGIVDGAVVTVLNIFGVPRSRVLYNLNANIYLFNANGDIVGIYENSGSINQYKGYYYGYEPPKKAIAEEYKKLFGEVIWGINADCEEINRLLKIAGTINEENTASVYTRIYQIVK